MEPEPDPQPREEGIPPEVIVQQAQEPHANAPTAPMAMDPSQWIADGEVSACTQCRKQFGSFRRKHHCRCCGGVFCWECSSNKLLLRDNHGAAQKMRVCDACKHAQCIAYAEEEARRNPACALRVFSAVIASDPPADPLLRSKAIEAIQKFRLLEQVTPNVANVDMLLQCIAEGQPDGVAIPALELLSDIVEDEGVYWEFRDALGVPIRHAQLLAMLLRRMQYDENYREVVLDDKSTMTARQAAAIVLDTLSRCASGRTKTLAMVLPLISEGLRSDEWWIQEAAGLALGAISDERETARSSRVASPELADRMRGEFLPQLLDLIDGGDGALDSGRDSRNIHPQLRGICCWALSRFPHLLDMEEDGAELMATVVLRMCGVMRRTESGDGCRIFRVAATSALAEILEACGPGLGLSASLGFVEPAALTPTTTLNTLIDCFRTSLQTFQGRELCTLCDAIATLAERKDKDEHSELLNRPEVLPTLATALISRLQMMEPYEKRVSTIFDALTGIARAIREGFREYVKLAWKLSVETCRKAISFLLSAPTDALVSMPASASEADADLLPNCIVGAFEFCSTMLEEDWASLGTDILSTLVSESGLMGVIQEVSAMLTDDAVVEPGPEPEREDCSSDKRKGDLGSQRSPLETNAIERFALLFPELERHHQAIMSVCGEVIRRCDLTIVEAAEAAGNTAPAPTKRVLDVILSSLRTLTTLVASQPDSYVASHNEALNNAIWAASEYAKACGPGLLAVDVVAILTACGEACPYVLEGELVSATAVEAFRVLYEECDATTKMLQCITADAPILTKVWWPEAADTVRSLTDALSWNTHITECTFLVHNNIMRSHLENEPLTARAVEMQRALLGVLPRCAIERVQYYSLETHSVRADLIQPLQVNGGDGTGPSTIEMAASINTAKRLSRAILRPYQRLLLAAMYARPAGDSTSLVLIYLPLGSDVLDSILRRLEATLTCPVGSDGHPRVAGEVEFEWRA